MLKILTSGDFIQSLADQSPYNIINKIFNKPVNITA